MDETGHITFTGIHSTARGSYTRGHGTSPGVAVIYAYPQDDPPPIVGTLAITFGDVRLQFRDCLLDSLSPQFSGSGRIVECRIKDRRWRWGSAVISGRYNIYFDDGNLDYETEKSPQEIAALLFEAMGESGADVSQLPNDTRPSIDWNLATAANELDRLCDSLGCRVVLRTNDEAAICRLGVGMELPNSPLSGGGASMDPPETPTEIKIVSDLWLQYDFPLRAVGMDVDNELKLIDDLSYAPAAGWDEGDVLGDMLGLAATPQARKLAQETVFRWYQINIPSGGFDLSKLGVFERPESRRQIELLPFQIETTTDIDGREERRGPAVYGMYWADRDNGKNEGETESSVLLPLDQDSTDDYHLSVPYRGGFSLDLEKHLVRFGSPVYKLGAAAGGRNPVEEASLRLRIAFRVRRKGSLEPVYSEAVKSLGGGFAPAKVVTLAEPVRSVRPTYLADASFFITGNIDNVAEWQAEAQRVADAVAAEFETVQAATATYEAIIPASPDGAIHLVAWEVGNGTAKTTINRNTDVQRHLPSYRERRYRSDLASGIADDKRAAINAKAAAASQPGAM